MARAQGARVRLYLMDVEEAMAKCMRQQEVLHTIPRSCCCCKKRSSVVPPL